MSSPSLSVSTRKVIGVDLDDVLAKTGDALAKFHNATYGTAYSRDDVSSFHLNEIWKCTPEEARARIHEFMSTDFHHESEAVFGARDALKRLGETYEIVVVTGRMSDWHDATSAWLEKNFLGLYREVHFTSHDNPDASKRRLKSNVVKELGMSLFIDDALHFAKDVAETGIPVLLFDTPWNQGEIPTGVTRVHSWDEILTTLLSENGLEIKK